MVITIKEKSRDGFSRGRELTTHPIYKKILSVAPVKRKDYFYLSGEEGDENNLEKNVHSSNFSGKREDR